MRIKKNAEKMKEIRILHNTMFRNRARKIMEVNEKLTSRNRIVGEHSLNALQEKKIKVRQLRRLRYENNEKEDPLDANKLNSLMLTVTKLIGK
jgi:hypothetical protein